jgi:hypothetical protein
MRLIEQFRVRSPDGQQHTVAYFQDSCERDREKGLPRYCLNGAETIARVDDDTFVAPNGAVLHRERRGC